MLKFSFSRTFPRQKSIFHIIPGLSRIFKDKNKIPTLSRISQDSGHHVLKISKNLTKKEQRKSNLTETKFGSSL